MAGTSSSGGAGAKLTTLGFVMILGLVGMGGMLMMGGSEDPPPSETSCLAAVPAAAVETGGDPAPAPSGKGVTMPLKDGTYQLSSPFGPRDGAAHQGSDLAAPLGTPIYAAHDGTVAASGPADGFGNWIVVDFDDNGKASNVYGHMRAQDLKVKTGDKVSAGQVIAAVGSEGQSSGPHLHFELWTGGTRLAGGHAVDPMPWLRNAEQPKAPRGPPAAVAVADRGTGCGDVPTGSTLKPGSVPPAFEKWIIEAGKICPEISAPLIAAQIENESNFNPNARNGDSGASGAAQFMPEVWPSKGVDGDGNGAKDPLSIPDAVMSMGHFDCELVGIMREAMASGQVRGDLIELVLSSYNCGDGGTKAAGGVCQNSETQNYVKKIPLRAREHFANPNPINLVSAAGPDVAAGEGFGGRVVAAAMKWRGTTYAWGGGTIRGPSKGVSDGGGAADAHGDYNKIGFDCSGLVIYAVGQASAGKIELPHYTTLQMNDPRGRVITGGQSQWRPGDIIFPAGADPQHVVIYIGDGKVVEAPQSGDVVKVSPVANQGANPSVRRFG